MSLIAARFGGQAPNAFDILMPPGVDLLVLDHAPLEMAGRVAARDRPPFDDDPVSWPYREPRRSDVW